MNLTSLVNRLRHGITWFWVSDDYRAALPENLASTVMSLNATDRLHAKQGRSTARVRFDSPWGPLSVYLKRHDRSPWTTRLQALVHPAGRHSAGATEWAHLQHARSLGVPVPDPVAAGEWIGPWGRLTSFLMVADLADCLPLHEAVPLLHEALPPPHFERLKRRLAAEMAAITARLHAADLYHMDLYLCHFFLNPAEAMRTPIRLTLIDLHRLARHRLLATRWRAKDLGALLFSTFDVPGISDRDRLRFWAHYRRLMNLRFASLELRTLRIKADRYWAHNRPGTPA